MGDLVALGPDPVELLELLAALPNVRCIGGNTERYVLTGDRPYPDFGAVRQNPDLLERLVTVATSFAWTRGAITQAGWRDAGPTSSSADIRTTSRTVRSGRSEQ